MHIGSFVFKYAVHNHVVPGDIKKTSFFHRTCNDTKYQCMCQYYLVIIIEIHFNASS